jgi:hypothetical protein
VGVAFHTAQRTSWLLAKTVHWTVSLRSALAGLFASIFFDPDVSGSKKDNRFHP